MRQTESKPLASDSNSNRILELIANRIGAMNQNLVEKDFSVEVHNNAPNVKSTVRTGEKVRTGLDRSGVDFNER
jgi:hypothetical protein